MSIYNTYHSYQHYPDSKPKEVADAAGNIKSFRGNADVSSPADWLKFIDSVATFNDELYVDTPGLKIARLMPIPAIKAGARSKKRLKLGETQLVNVARFVRPSQPDLEINNNTRLYTRDVNHALISIFGLGVHIKRLAIASSGNEFIVKKAIKNNGGIIDTIRLTKEAEEIMKTDFDTALKTTLLPSELVPDGVDFYRDIAVNGNFKLPFELMDRE